MYILHTSLKDLTKRYLRSQLITVQLDCREKHNSLMYIPQNAAGTKTILVNSEKWKLSSNITEFSSKLPVL